MTMRMTMTTTTATVKYLAFSERLTWVKRQCRRGLLSQFACIGTNPKPCHRSGLRLDRVGLAEIFATRVQLWLGTSGFRMFIFNAQSHTAKAPSFSRYCTSTSPSQASVTPSSFDRQCYLTLQTLFFLNQIDGFTLQASVINEHRT